jgi:hypothetical protein
VAALLALLTTWLVTMGGTGGKDRGNGANGKNPAPSITPGPSSSGRRVGRRGLGRIVVRVRGGVRRRFR